MAFVMSAGLAQVESSVKAVGRGNGRRYTLVQNCFRYFDLQNIGGSPHHLSLFQMPGAFTFGRHRKKVDIEQTFRLLTDIFQFSPERLWATYFHGDMVEGIELPSDDESCEAWIDAGVPPEQVIGLGADHNFWKQNANFVGANHAAKCGPNTEIFFDKGKHLNCGTDCSPPCGCGRFVEISNTLFITLNIDENGRTVFPLDEPFTETVIGSERVEMLLQGVSSVFNIDCIKPMVEFVINQSKNTFEEKDVEISKHSHIIADHIRAIIFLTADGAPPPGKGGRARLMRKLIREMLTSIKILNVYDKGFIPSLIDCMISLYSKENIKLPAYRQRALDHIIQESKSFDKTIEKGLRQLRRLSSAPYKKSISGEEILALEKHFGVPMPLLENEVHKLRLRFDLQEYLSAYSEWKSNLLESNSGK
jgi:alanyl-tRNA synthetase